MHILKYDYEMHFKASEERILDSEDHEKKMNQSFSFNRFKMRFITYILVGYAFNNKLHHHIKAHY